MSTTSNTFLFNNIYVNFGESTFDLNTNFFPQADQPKDSSTFYFESSCSQSSPINIPTTNSSSSSLNIYDPQQQQQQSSPFINHNSLHLYSPISTSDDSFCFSPAADSDFLSASASSPASSSLGSYMANETFLNTTSIHQDQLFNQQDFCLNDSLSGSQQDYHHATTLAYTIPAVQVQPEEDSFLPTPVPSNASTPSFQQDYTNMFMASPTLSMDSSAMMNNYSSFQQQPYYPHHQEQQQQHITKPQTRRRTPKVHQCPHCPHTSNRANNMKEHILTHDPNRPKKFPCPKCGKRFARKHDMKRHSKSPHH